MKKALVIAALVLALGGTQASAQDTIAGVVTSVTGGDGFDNQLFDYDVLLTALVTATNAPTSEFNFLEFLSDPSLEVTVFGPNDLAFIRLARDLGYTGFNEEEAWNFLVGALGTLSPNGDPIPVLTAVLLYHVSPESLSVVDIFFRGFFRGTIPTFQGETIRPFFFRLIDKARGVRNPRLTYPLNIVVGDSRIQTINRVLIPLPL